MDEPARDAMTSVDIYNKNKSSCANIARAILSADTKYVLSTHCFTSKVSPSMVLFSITCGYSCSQVLDTEAFIMDGINECGHHLQTRTLTSHLMRIIFIVYARVYLKSSDINCATLQHVSRVIVRRCSSPRLSSWTKPLAMPWQALAASRRPPTR